MRSKTSVAARILVSPRLPPRYLSVTNEIVIVPPSPRQVQLGGFRSSPSQRMFGDRTSVRNWLPPKPFRPAALQWPSLRPSTLTMCTPVGGYHWNELIAPTFEVFETVIR